MRVMVVRCVVALLSLAALTATQAWAMPGMSASAEVAWLKSNAAVVKGSVAHGIAPGAQIEMVFAKVRAGGKTWAFNATFAGNHTIGDESFLTLDGIKPANEPGAVVALIRAFYGSSGAGEWADARQVAVVPNQGGLVASSYYAAKGGKLAFELNAQELTVFSATDLAARISQSAR